MAQYTPMMEQYFKIKEQHQDAIVFYRLGDFYEMFFDDAKTASKELELVLTGRECGAEERAPMCGVPFHSAEGYIARLVQKGYKVAICEQVEDPATAKGLVKRDIVRTISKGTVIEDSMLEDNQNNFIASVYLEADGGGVCFCDMSTGEAHATQCTGKTYVTDIFNELARFNPSELYLSDTAYHHREFMDYLAAKEALTISNGGLRPFVYGIARTVAEEQFHLSLDDDNVQLAVSAVGALISYLKETQKNDLAYINSLSIYSTESFMQVDGNAKRNLEILTSLRNNDKKDTLLWVLDHTKTAMGGRLIKKWLSNPLLDVVQIENRLWAVKNLMDDIVTKDKLAEVFKEFYDIERIISRVSFGSANSRDLKALGTVCTKLPQVKALAEGLSADLLKHLAAQIDDLQDMAQLIASAISDTPPFSVREGGMIQDGYHELVDHYRGLVNNSSQKLLEIEQREKEATGIKTMKVGYNKVFGYYIEISRGAAASAPDSYIRKQTLTNCERFITEELKILEGEILSASDKLTALEYELFCQVRSQIAENAPRFQKTAAAIGALDVLCSFAQAALQNNYVCPTVSTGDRIEIVDGRHPVVEAVLKGDMFVPNDTLLDCEQNRMAIITGPNMAGKSTYMKQTALIVIMAQCGSFVPAKYANIGICDKVFTRVGASDDLAGGRSTFMVEMTEVADILANATKKSLLILDEIGRGTSTYDGMAIARAVLEYTAGKKALGAKTMFATHYHELTELENSVEGVKNYNIVVKKRGDDIIFIKKIVPGGADDSYGVEVAKLAGLPGKVIARAKEILAELESQDPRPRLAAATAKQEEHGQLTFESTAGAEILAQLKAITPDVLTPIEALNIVHQLVIKAKNS